MAAWVWSCTSSARRVVAMDPNLSCPVYKNRLPLQLSESSVPTSNSFSPLRPLPALGGIGSIPPPGSAVAPQSTIHGHSTLTLANLARINNANALDCHQGKASLHQSLKKGPLHQSESVADASYYSSVLASFGSGSGAPGLSSSQSAAANSNNTVPGAVGPSVVQGGSTEMAVGGLSGNWPKSQYYR